MQVVGLPIAFENAVLQRMNFGCLAFRTGPDSMSLYRIALANVAVGNDPEES